jgi:MFS family permease
MRYISKKDFTILLGNAIDHFDTSIYVFIAPLIAPIFFPNENPVIELILAYSILGTSMITRPLGTYIFGCIARIYGAGEALAYSLVGVGLATMLMGFLPDYYSIGFFAPVLLVLIRMVRDVFAAGESSIAKLYILHDKVEKEALKGSYLYQTSTIFGMVVASFAATFVQYLEIKHAWRICFIFGGVAAIIGYLIRLNILKVNKINKKNILKLMIVDNTLVMWKHKISLIKIAIVTSFSHMTYLIPFVTMNHIIPLITDIQATTMLLLNSFMLVFDMVAIPIIGEYTKRFSIKNVMLTASSVLALTIVPLWYYVNIPSIEYISFVRFWIVIWGIVFLCPLNLWCSNRVMGDEKYIIVGMGNALGASTIGQLSPSICLSLYYYTNSHIAIGFYAALLFFLAFMVVYMSDTNK